MIVDLQQLETVRYKFTDLGRTLADLSDKNERLFDDTLKALREGFQPLIEKLSAEIIKSVSSVSRIQEGFEDQANAEKAHVEFFARSSATLDQVAKISVDINSLSKFNALLTESGKDIILRISGDKKTGITISGSSANKEPSYWAKEWKGIKSKVSGFMHKTYIPSPGNVGATILGMIGAGFLMQDRLKAQAGEVANILVEASDSSMKDIVKNAKNEIASLQENLQLNYGIARQETQAVLASLIHGGVSAADAIKGIDAGIVGVKNTLTSFSLAVDKMFDLAGGTSANRMVSLMSDYGKSLDEARKSMFNMMMAGKESGIGTMNFLKSIDSAGSILQGFGFDIDEVVKLSVTMQESFEKLGLPKQFAGKFAAEGLQSIASSVSSWSNDMKSYMSVRMGYAEELGPEAVLAFDNALDRVVRTKNNKGSEELTKIIYHLASLALEKQGGDRTRAKYMLKNFQGMDLGEKGSELALKLKEAIDRGDQVAINKIKSSSMEEFRNAFVKEKQKVSDFQLRLNQILKGVGEMGQALMGLAVTAISTVIITFQALYWRFDDLTIPELLAWLATGKKPDKGGVYAEHEAKIAQAYKDVSRTWDQNVAKLSEGWKKTSGGFAGMGKDFLGPAFETLQKAVALSSLPGASSDVPVLKAQLAPPTLQIRTVPVVVRGGGGSKLGERQPILSPTDIGNMAAEEEAPWVGGDLYLVTEGVDESGNIQLSVVGRCPRCGLQFGDSTVGFDNKEIAGVGYTPEDVEAMARVLASETTPRFGGDPYKSATSLKEAVAIGWTLLNRLRNPQQRHGSTIYDIVTMGKGYGAQGPRAYSSAKEATPETVKLAKELLSGKYQDPTKGAELFFHDYGKAYSYGIPKGGDPTKGHALPEFTKGATNTLNLDTAPGITLRTYSKSAGKGAEDPRAAAMDKEDLEKWTEAFGSKG